jgi:hypothetical protein
VDVTLEVRNRNESNVIYAKSLSTVVYYMTYDFSLALRNVVPRTYFVKYSDFYIVSK